MWRFFKYSAVIYLLNKYKQKIKPILFIALSTLLMLLVISDIRFYFQDEINPLFLILFKWAWIITALFLIYKIAIKKSKISTDPFYNPLSEDKSSLRSEPLRYGYKRGLIDDKKIEKATLPDIEDELLKKESLRSKAQIAIDRAKKRKARG